MKHLWCIDSGCLHHLYNSDSKFVNLCEAEIKCVCLANIETTKVTDFGKAFIEAEINTKLQNIQLHETWLVRKLKTILLSVARICDREYTVTFKEHHTVIKKKSRTM